MWASQDKVLRAVGSSVVLLALAVFAIVQIEGGEVTAASLSPESGPVTTAGALTTQLVAEAPTTTTAEPEPFVYRLGVLRGISTDNFWAFYGADHSVWNAYILGPTKPALLAYDPVDGGLRPELAEEIPTPELQEGGWVVTVPLDPSMEWSDGTAITSADVVFTFETVRHLGLGGGWSQAFPDSIEVMLAEGPHRLRIEFSERPTLEVWPHGAGLAPVMAEHVWGHLVTGITPEELYEMSDVGDVGGGPLTLESVADDLVISVANPGYRGSPAPDVVEYHVFADEPAAAAALADGLIDSILTPRGLTEPELDTLASSAEVAVETSPANGVRYLGFNLQREPMSHHGFRRALALLLDREEMASAIHGGVAAYHFVSPANASWFDAGAAEAIAAPYRRLLGERLEEAVEALREEGYTWDGEPALDEAGDVVAGTGLRVNGLEPATLTILTPGDAYDPARRFYADRIAETLGWLGWEVLPVETDFDTVVDLAFLPNESGDRTYDMYLLGWTLGSPSLPAHYRPLFAAESPMNSTGYDSAGFARHLASYEGAYTQAQARDALWAMEATLAEDLPYLVLYTSHITEVYRSDRVAYGVTGVLGGIQGRLGGIGDVAPVR